MQPHKILIEFRVGEGWQEDFKNVIIWEREY